MDKTTELIANTGHNIIGTMFEVFSKFYYPIAVRKASYSNHHADAYHRHDFPQVWYCSKGNYFHVVDGVGYDCKPGSLIIVPPGTRHAYEIMRGEYVELICLEGTFYFFNEMNEPYRTNTIANMFCHCFSDELTYSREHYIQLCGEERRVANEILSFLCRQDYKQKIIDILQIKKKIGEFFSLPSFILNSAQYERTVQFIDHKLGPMMNSVAYLNKHYSEKIHREDVIKVSTLCQTDFFKLIKKIVGTTYSLYLQMIRVRRAQLMITFSTFSFTYIADQCGFGNRTYMGKVFKKYYGLNMSEDRALRDQRISEYPFMIMTHDFWDKIKIE